MTNTMSQNSKVSSTAVDPRANVLAERLERGAQALAAFAADLSDGAWGARVPHDGRTIGVVVHHVASVYPVEIHLAQILASGKPVVDVVWDTVHQMNAGHALENAGVSKQAALELLRINSTAAAAAIRALSGEELDRAATASLYDDAPITCQFMLEDHAVRHSYHHLAVLRKTVEEAGL